MNAMLDSSTLLEWLAQQTLLGGVLLLVVWLWCRLARGLSAARRHFLLTMALLCLPVLMAGGWLFGQVGWLRPLPAPMVSAIWSGGGEAASERKAVVESLSPIEPDVGQSSPAFAAKGRRSWQTRALMSLWLAGMAVGLLALLMAAGKLARLRRTSALERDQRLLAAFQESKRALNVQAVEIELRRGETQTMPMTWGWRRPAVLLPDGAASWPQARLRLVFRHELSHVARRDAWTTLAAAVAVLPLWFHPLVWLVRRDQLRAREQACDDLAWGVSGRSREDFAEQLLEAVAAVVGRRSRGLTLALAMSVSSGVKGLRLRVDNLLNEGRGRKAWSGVQAAVCCSGLGLAALLLGGLSACGRVPVEVAQNNPGQIELTGKIFSVPNESPLLQAAGLKLRTIPGISFLGVLEMEAAERLTGQLEQTEGVKLTYTGKLRSMVGKYDRLEIIREFLYPTEFDPPEYDVTGTFVSPTTPTTFEMRPVGLMMDVFPQLRGEDMLLRVKFSVTTFEGFANYGSPILGRKVDENGKPTDYVISENLMNQPVFNTIESGFPVTLKEGQYFVMGGTEVGGDIPPVMKEIFLQGQAVEEPKTTRSDSVVLLIFQARRAQP